MSHSATESDAHSAHGAAASVWDKSFSAKTQTRLLKDDSTAWRTVVMELLAVVTLGLGLMIITIVVIMS